MPSVCDQPYMPGVDPATYEQNLAAVNTAIATNWGASPVATAEPALKQYVYAHN
jgi:hypothetical protein